MNKYIYSCAPEYPPPHPPYQNSQLRLLSVDGDR